MRVAAQDNQETRRQLEILQVRAFKNFGFTFEQIQDLYQRRETEWVPYCIRQSLRLSLMGAVAEKSIEAWEAECKAQLDQVPTRYENPPDYEIVRERFDELHSIAASVDRSLPFRPLLGTIAEGDLNARVLHRAGYILAVNGGALKISWGLAKILALSLPTLESNSTRQPFDTDWPEVQRHLQTSPEPSQRFRELLDAIVTRKHPYFAPRYLIDSDNKKMLGFVLALNRGLELFLVGHEYAHLADGHRDGKIRQMPEDEFPRTPIRLGNRTLDSNLQFTREFDADQLGLLLAYKALEAQQVNTEASLIGAVLSIRALEILNKVRQLGQAEIRSGALGGLAHCDDQQVVGTTHPPTSCRVWLLKQHAQKQPEVLKEVELVERIFEHLSTQ